MPTARLAAILFTDIVGYTAMMQTDQERAMAAVKQYETVLRYLIDQHKGELLQTYGDGSLSVFDSASAAVRCAKELQEQIRDQVPLRIGIHLGEITIDGEHIFGDGVNIASRIESMGIAGSVLVSSSIRQQIKNKPAFELESLGKFAFKNVAEPMTVYALANEGFAVPKPEEMKGKGEKVEPNSPKTGVRNLIRMASIGFVAMLVGAGIFWAVGTRVAEDGQLLDKDIREAKVAVNVFENFTGEEELDAIGYLASEWITSSLREIGVNTVAPEMIRQYKDYIGILPDNPEGKTSFATITKSHYLISGSYFLKGDSLRLIARLLNSNTGEEIQQFPIIWARKSDHEALVEETRQRLMGYWAIEKNQHFPKVKPPKYKAYQKFLECRPGALPCYQAVLELDSTFLLGHVSAMSTAVWWNNSKVFNDSKQYVLAHWDQCTDYEKNYFRHNVAFGAGEYQEAFPYYEANYQMDTLNLIMLHQTAYFASAHLNRPYFALKRYEPMFSNYEAFRDFLWPSNFYHYFDALNRTGQSDKVVDFFQKMPRQDWKNMMTNSGRFEVYIAYLKTGQPSQAIRYADTLLAHSPSVDNLSMASSVWSTILPDSVPNPFHKRIIARIDEFQKIEDAGHWTINGIYQLGAPFKLKAYQTYLLQDWETAETEFLQMKENGPSLPNQGALAEVNEGVWEVWRETMLGSIYARQGKTEQALAQIAILEKLSNTFPSKFNPTARGIIPYFQARIYALLGNKEEAVRLLEQSLQEGKSIIWLSFLTDFDLAPLLGYPPFEELCQPQG